MALNGLKKHFLQNIGTPVESKTLQQIAGICRWHQRIDELRNQFGFCITFDTGRYICSHIDQSRIKRRVQPSVQCKAIIDERDKNACVICFKKQGERYDNQQVVRLEYDHIKPHSSEQPTDPNEPADWQLLCNRHNNMKRDDRDFFQRGELCYLTLLKRASEEEKKVVYAWLQKDLFPEITPPMSISLPSSMTQVPAL